MMRRPSGFTLLEVLIAIAIAALVSLLGYRALQSLTESESRLSAEAQRWRVLDQFFSRLEADLREVMPRAVRVSDGREPAWIGRVGDGGDAELVFSRAGPEFDIEPGSAGQRIEYRLRDGAIQVVYWPRYDRPAGTTPSVYALVEGVASFRVRYLSTRGEWHDRWPPGKDDPVPRGLRVELALQSGDVVERILALR